MRLVGKANSIRLREPAKCGFFNALIRSICYANPWFVSYNKNIETLEYRDMTNSTHGGCSNIYRQERIPTHDVQFRATILVFQYLSKKYTYYTLQRHITQIGAALKHIELDLHKEASDDKRL